MAIDKIGSKALVDCSVAAADIAPGTITGTQLAGSIANAKLANSTVTINGTSIALGASASIAALAWQSVVVSDGSTVTTMVAGRGYFVNNTSAAGIVKLPAGGTAGDTIAIKDYAGNFATNKLTIQRNGHNIQGVANDSEIKTNRASVVLVYIDATKGWLFTNESNVADLQTPSFVAATGGTVTTSGNFKIHSFTGDGNFVVSSLGNPTGGPSNVDYLVVAGAGSGGTGFAGVRYMGGGGAGGYRTTFPSPGCNAGAFPIAAQTYPITVGGGGAAPAAINTKGNTGTNSVFSTITSAGGGAGGGSATPTHLDGGSGGGGGYNGNPSMPGGAGNTPPTSPPQGNNGGSGVASSGGGGGGASAVGGNASAPTGGNGGAGSPNSITASAVTYAGGGGGSGNSTAGSGGAGGGGAGHPTDGVAGTANTGGGGGGTNVSNCAQRAGAGGKGIVIIRYKFQ